MCPSFSFDVILFIVLFGLMTTRLNKLYNNNYYYYSYYYKQIIINITKQQSVATIYML